MSKLITFSLAWLFLSLGDAQVMHVNEGNLRIKGSDTIRVNANSGDVIEAVFAIQNRSNDTLKIHQVVSQCICFQYAYPETGIAPGSVDSIRLFFMTKHVPPGPYFKRLFADYEGGSIEMIMEGMIKVMRPVYKRGEAPKIYKPKQILIANDPS
ncbi:MAG: DUF1573 domain-containing protein [Bacteroidota bacterium]|nr:DUF1573 domain-containing protein [Bacteroidota bacterium]